ncbi:MAG: anthranilate phosphoribosyltransferase [Pseudomonadota bacterium]
MSNPFTPYLRRASNGETFGERDMQAAIDAILAGSVSDVETAGFLMALRARGETIEEIIGAARAMRAAATPVTTPHDVIDTAGTGGDGAATYNISTAAALIAAGAGAKVAKHGNRAASSLSGSSDVLAAAGVNLSASPKTISACIDQAGVGFMFAAFHHKAVAQVAGVRKALGIRTLFNLLGPLTNPAGARRQLMGVFDETLLTPLANALRALGGTHGWVVHGMDGLDELSISGPSQVCAFTPEGTSTFEVTPGDAGLAIHPIEAIKGGTPEENHKALVQLLDGEKNAYRDVAVLNAAAALVVGGLADTLEDGAHRAANAIDKGKARAVLAQLVALSQRVTVP